MPKKNIEEVDETVVETKEGEVTDVGTVESHAAEAAPAAEEIAVEAAPVVDEPQKEESADAAPTAETAAPVTPAAKKTGNKRAEKVGIVSSDKMMKTVVVRVDRLVKHPIYRKYVKKRKKFMAHDEMGAAIGDKVKIVETRPLSARKRWRVVEIIQKAQN
jgi:small subunit ribosomal protein S17